MSHDITGTSLMRALRGPDNLQENKVKRSFLGTSPDEISKYLIVHAKLKENGRRFSRKRHDKP